MTVKTILFDLDGVLIWHHPSDPSKDWRGKISSTDILMLWEEFQRSQYWNKCLRDHTLNTRQYFLNYLYEQGHILNGHEQIIIDIWLKHNIEPCHPALKKLAEFQDMGLECAIATNQDGLRKPHIKRFLQMCGLSHLTCFMSCDVNAAKPDLEYYMSIQKTLNRKPHELMLIDDTQENISGAQRAGWSAFHIDSSYRLTPEKWNSIDIFSINSGTLNSLYG